MLNKTLYENKIKPNRKLLLLLFLHCLLIRSAVGGEWIRINQLGYLPESVKVAVFISEKETDNPVFDIKDSKTNVSVFSGKGIKTNAARWGMKAALRLNFSKLEKSGSYYIECNNSKSPVFQINNNVYDGTADFLLKYMRQQRCGYNPYFDTLCHQHDGYIVYQPGHTGEKTDVRGGWHDASDCLQYLPTSANATFQMLFAWQQTPDKTIFKDEYTASGKKGSNGVPDILDEIRWGLEWMARMNPDSAVMYNQIADDRDHAGMRLPQYDSVDYGYGKGLGRPVYFITGEPQGLSKYKNRSTGVSSSAAKFASTFALGAEIFKNIDPAFAKRLKEKAVPAYNFGEAVPGNFQTACTVSPYFYEEDNWVDDMELAAAVMFDVSKDDSWLKKADYWGVLEEVTPWMELNRARHYQFYPFVNLGHYYLAQQTHNKMFGARYKSFMKKGMDALLNRAKGFDDPFLNGIPFIWCSNNLITAAITQARLYHEITGDETYLEMEAAMRDWLFGCNPWGTSMICGLPANGNSPKRTHSFVVELKNDITYGGLTDGPVYRTIYESLLGIVLKYSDPYIPFNNGEAVYHDDPGDYSTDEPTMDGTASLTFYLSTMQKLGNAPQKVKDSQGATIRINPDKKAIYLIFSADTQFEGANAILQTLDRNRIKTSFFLTGNCLRKKEFESLIGKIVEKGHYVGGHSDRHLLYASWEKRDSSLVSTDSLVSDLKQNTIELSRFVKDISEVKYFLPPYEYYNRESVKLIESQRQTVINFTSGLRTAADYTTPDMKNYMSSQQIIDHLYEFEKKEGLNGAIILIHPGTENSRTDKLYLRLDEIIKTLKNKGYTFERL